jgi:hypothetical protein
MAIIGNSYLYHMRKVSSFLANKPARSDRKLYRIWWNTSKQVLPRYILLSLSQSSSPNNLYLPEHGREHSRSPAVSISTGLAHSDPHRVHTSNHRILLLPRVLLHLLLHHREDPLLRPPPCLPRLCPPDVRRPRTGDEEGPRCMAGTDPGRGGRHRWYHRESPHAQPRGAGDATRPREGNELVRESVFSHCPLWACLPPW